MRFSQIYIREETPQKDSRRFRNRLEAYIDTFLLSSRVHRKEEICGLVINTYIRPKIGAEAPRGINYLIKLKKYFKEAELRDVLDGITGVWLVLGVAEEKQEAKSWRSFVEKVFKEEHLCYSIDDKAVVHFSEDEEFHESVFSTLACLENKRYSAVKEVFQKARDKLDGEKPDLSGSIKDIFESNEILYKLLVGGDEKDRLTRLNIDKKVRKIVSNVYQSDETARNAATKFLDSFCGWIDSAHMYRHGQNKETHSEPPHEFTIVMFSAGVSYLRWMVNIDGMTNSPS